MNVFSSVEAAAEFGFSWFNYDEESRLHVVFRDMPWPDGRKRRYLALALP